MKNNGKRTMSSAGSRPGHGTIDGKKGHVDQHLVQKTTVKYTLNRTKEDLKELDKVRKIFKEQYYGKKFNTDSKIYRMLPVYYLDAVKKIHDQDLVIDELTAERAQLQQLRSSVCRILEICKN